jgi:hypothetical protein
MRGEPFAKLRERLDLVRFLRMQQIDHKPENRGRGKDDFGATSFFKRTFAQFSFHENNPIAESILRIKPDATLKF